MSLLIDGYNFLAASGVFASGPPTLARTREALLDFLAGALTPEEAAKTVIVFDASQAPPGLPHSLTHRGLRVRFSPKGQVADDVIEELIRLDSAPKSLTVVSSDHRIQRAAKRRKARAIDSEVFRAELARRKGSQQSRGTDSGHGSLGDANDTQAWLAEFGVNGSKERTEDSVFPFDTNEPDDG
jgi:predicted RNA-binding protein with PIN domain